MKRIKNIFYTLPSVLFAIASILVLYDTLISGKNIIMHLIFFSMLLLYTLWSIFRLKTFGLVADTLDNGNVRKRLNILEAGSTILNLFVSALLVMLIFYRMFHDRMPLFD